MRHTKRQLVLRGVLALLTVALLATAACASGGEGSAHAVDSGKLIKDFIYRCFNFAVMAGLLIYLLTKPIRNGLASRREAIEKSLRDAEAARQEAEARFSEYDAKLTKAAAEIEEMRTAIRREGEVERDRILANAREMAEKLKVEAEKAAENEVARARAELRAEASRLAITMAEELLRKHITGDDQQRLVNEYMSKVGELH